jgi:CheY-like chemotaxis protein
MWIAILLGVCVTVTIIAIVVAAIATLRARAAQTRLAAIELELQGRPNPASVTVVPAAGTGTSGEEAQAGDETPKLRVLVVEDEPGVRELITRTLARGGREVVAVKGPFAALTALSNGPDIALMIIDIVMPEMDGYDLAVEARKISPYVRVVFMSAFACDPARQPHGDGFLSKPFTTESLIAIVDEALAF